MNFNGGGWIVEALKMIAENVHLRIMAYGLVFAVVLHGFGYVRWW